MTHFALTKPSSAHKVLSVSCARSLGSTRTIPAAQTISTTIYPACRLFGKAAVSWASRRAIVSPDRKLTRIPEGNQNIGRYNFAGQEQAVLHAYLMSAYGDCTQRALLTCHPTAKPNAGCPHRSMK